MCLIILNGVVCFWYCYCTVLKICHVQVEKDEMDEIRMFGKNEERSYVSEERKHE